MKCKLCNQRDIMIYPYTRRICYDCYKHIPNCVYCRNNKYTNKSDIASFVYLLFSLSYLIILIYLLLNDNT